MDNQVDISKDEFKRLWKLIECSEGKCLDQSNFRFRLSRTFTDKVVPRGSDKKSGALSEGFVKSINVQDISSKEEVTILDGEFKFREVGVTDINQFKEAIVHLLKTSN